MFSGNQKPTEGSCVQSQGWSTPSPENEIWKRWYDDEDLDDNNYVDADFDDDYDDDDDDVDDDAFHDCQHLITKLLPECTTVS